MKCSLGNAEVRALVVFVLGVFCGDWLSNLPDAHPRSPLPDPRRSLRPWARGSYHPVWVSRDPLYRLVSGREKGGDSTWAGTMTFLFILHSQLLPERLA